MRYNVCMTKDEVFFWFVYLPAVIYLLGWFLIHW